LLLASLNDPSSFEDVYDSAGMSMTCFGNINNVKTEMLLDTGSVFSIINYDLYKTINQRSVSEMTISPFISRIISANNESIISVFTLFILPKHVIDIPAES
jgi:hypothetical protein